MTLLLCLNLCVQSWRRRNEPTSCGFTLISHFVEWKHSSESFHDTHSQPPLGFPFASCSSAAPPGCWEVRSAAAPLASGRSITFYDLRRAKVPARYKFSPPLWIKYHNLPQPKLSSTRAAARVGVGGPALQYTVLLLCDLAKNVSSPVMSDCIHSWISTSAFQAARLTLIFVLLDLLCVVKRVFIFEIVCCFPVVICSGSKPTWTI